MGNYGKKAVKFAEKAGNTIEAGALAAGAGATKVWKNGENMVIRGWNRVGVMQLFWLFVCNMFFMGCLVCVYVWR